MAQSSAAAVKVDDSLSHQRWNDPQYPYNPLDRSTALQYFEFSPFFDTNSNNYEARRQGLDPSVEAHLKQMPMDTTEFALAETYEPHLYVVRKQQRQSAAAGKAQVSNYFYILGHERHTYQAPSLHAAVTGRLQRAMHHVREGFNRFKADLAPLPKVLRDAEKGEELKQQQLDEMAAAMDVDAAPAAGGGGGQAGAGGSSQVPAGAAAAKPVAVPEMRSADELEHWAKTDSIIMNVLRRYPMPRLPKSKAEQEQEKQRQLEKLNTAQQPPQQPPQQQQPPTQQQQHQQRQQQPPQQQQQLLPQQQQQLDPAAAAAMPVTLVPGVGAAGSRGTSDGGAAQQQTGAVVKGKSRLRKTGSLQQMAAAAAAATAAGDGVEAAALPAGGADAGSGHAAAATRPSSLKRPRQQQGGAKPVSSSNSQGSAGLSHGSFGHMTAAAGGGSSGGGMHYRVGHAGPSAAPAPSASWGGAPSASAGGTASTAGRMKLKIKLGKPAEQQQGQQQYGGGGGGSQEPIPKRQKQ